MKYNGSCLCGKVAFEIDGEFDNFYFCHCERCRKDTGSAHAANLFSTTAKLNWLSGEDGVSTFHFNSDGHKRSFCSICGSALPNLQFDSSLLVVPAGCIDGDIHVKPSGHIYYANRANWDRNLEAVKKFDELPTQDE